VLVSNGSHTQYDNGVDGISDSNINLPSIIEGKKNVVRERDGGKTTGENSCISEIQNNPLKAVKM